ncbi:MAG: hypothetical protein IJ649_10050, partial [Oscillospiraceae bacterium]|nr:hypothetical protein [Oscillospiraceae bacterium]
EKKNEWNPRDYTEFGEKYNAKVKESLPEIAFRSRMKGLAGDLERSTHKSFAGKLKSFFVGNSDEYETALKAVKGLADGTADRRQAAIDIMGYLDIRKNKVRDHEYGRDRFDAMMKSLATVMEPEVFEAYCDSVDQARKQRDPGYKGKTDANAYLTDEGKRLLAEKKAETLRESDTNMIEKNAKNPAAAAEGVGCLDYLRKMENPTAKNLAWIDEQMHAHPEAREMARKIVLERKLNIEIPRTDVAKMDPETRKLLKEQEKRTQDLDRRQNPELYPKQPEAKSKGPEL